MAYFSTTSAIIVPGNERFRNHNDVYNVINEMILAEILKDFHTFLTKKENLAVNAKILALITNCVQIHVVIVISTATVLNYIRRIQKHFVKWMVKDVEECANVKVK